MSKARMSKASMWSLMVFVAGCPLLLIGMMGLAVGDCPRPVVQFPLPQAHCSAYLVVTAASSLLTIGGAVGLLAAVICEGVSEARGAGRSV